MCSSDKEYNSRGQRLEVVTISMSRALSKGRASLRLASSSSRNGLEGDTSSSCVNGGSGMPTCQRGKLKVTQSEVKGKAKNFHCVFTRYNSFPRFWIICGYMFFKINHVTKQVNVLATQTQNTSAALYFGKCNLLKLYSIILPCRTSTLNGTLSSLIGELTLWQPMVSL